MLNLTKYSFVFYKNNHIFLFTVQKMNIIVQILNIAKENQDHFTQEKFKTILTQQKSFKRIRFQLGK